jgi:hypothetical protein
LETSGKRWKKSLLSQNTINKEENIEELLSSQNSALVSRSPGKRA